MSPRRQVCCAMAATAHAPSSQHHWLIATRPPFDTAMTTYSDELYYRRLLALISVDDLLASVIQVLTDAGELNRTVL